MLGVVDLKHSCGGYGYSYLGATSITLELLGGESFTSPGSLVVASGASGTGIRTSGGVSSGHLIYSLRVS